MAVGGLPFAAASSNMLRSRSLARRLPVLAAWEPSLLALAVDANLVQERDTVDAGSKTCLDAGFMPSMPLQLAAAKPAAR